MSNPLVGIIVGSASDLEVIGKCSEVLDKYGIVSETGVISAHRALSVLQEYVAQASLRGIKVFVTAAGAAAALPGVVAALSPLPVIGVPLNATPLNGFDSLLSIVQMPPGVPVATVAVGEMGARNAGHLAARILALGDEQIAKHVDATRAEMSKSAQLPR